MTQNMKHEFEQVLRSSGSDWILRFIAPQHAGVDALIARLQPAIDLYAATYPRNAAPSLTLESIVSDYANNSHKIKAFLQGLGSTANPKMLVMVWRILQGDAITSVTMEYRVEQSFQLKVVLKGIHNDLDQTFVSDDINDASLLRHFGISTMNTLPLFDGFYPMLTA